MISQWGYDADFDASYMANSDIYNCLAHKSLLITGATGLVGTCLTEFLLFLKLRQNIDLTVSVLSSSHHNLAERFGLHIESGAITAYKQDIREPLPKDANFDFIVHAASVADPRRYQEAPVNVIDVTVAGTKNSLEYAKAYGARMVYISSVEVYGDISTMRDDITEEAFGPLDPLAVRCSYTESKRLAETMCKAYQSQYAVDVIIARLCKTYGPSNSRSDSRVMAYMLNTISKQKDIILNSDGSRVFSFCYVIDAVTAILTMMARGKTGEAYNVSDKNSVASLKEIANYSAKLAGVKVLLQPQTTTAISKDTVVNSTKLADLGWSPRTGIFEGLRKQLNAVKHSHGARII